MTQPSPHLVIERRADVLCARLRSNRMLETEIIDTAQELVDLVRSEKCRGLALSLGPKSPECLYSVFLAKLYWVQRVLGEQGASLVLCEVDPAVHAIFEACKLDDQFRFVADFDAAVAALQT
jgi:hypothetical protein